MIKSIWYEFDNCSDLLNEYDSNSDVIFELEDGSKWCATFFTYPNILTLSKKNEASGELCAGRYFCATNSILISTMSKDLIQQVICQLILQNEIELFCLRL